MASPTEGNMISTEEHQLRESCRLQVCVRACEEILAFGGWMRRQRLRPPIGAASVACERARHAQARLGCGGGRHDRIHLRGPRFRSGGRTAEAHIAGLGAASAVFR